MTAGDAKPPFERVLVANRGEIAVRVLRTLRELGIRSIAVYSEADRFATHPSFADEAYLLPGSPSEAYLSIPSVLDAARTAGAQAIHPGYGFLAENPDFARACEEAGLTFIGPPAAAIEAMGSKTAARALMQEAGVPVVPGTTEAVRDIKAAREAASEVGYPVAVKASAGGGGKGFRVAESADELEAAFSGAAGEGERYFGDAAVYVERYLHDPRHVEVQVLADSHGSAIHVGERDCSIQRRHQKIVEECPSPAVDEALREQIGEMAVRAARAVDYRGAGTIECLMTDQSEVFFLEMNTRIQVEHTITEEVSGLDLVAEQVRIAAGMPVSVAQDQVRVQGHAIECRINAEDAWNNFMPSTGTISAYREPAGPGVRVDSGVRLGSEVAAHYDPLFAKLIVRAGDRESARQRMLRALDEYVVEGPRTLIPFHRALLASDQFRNARTCRELVADPTLLGEAPKPLDSQLQAPHRLDPETQVVEVNGRRLEVRVFGASPAGAEPGAPASRQRSRRGPSGAGDGQIVAPMPGNVLRIAVEEGEHVAAGQLLCVVEAMKMENEIAAPADGVVQSVLVREGDAVTPGQLLIAVAANGSDAR